MDDVVSRVGMNGGCSRRKMSKAAYDVTYRSRAFHVTIYMAHKNESQE